jgi:p-hydroxybenzoate 3-monooxygenase
MTAARVRTQVAIIGAGPAGLLLSHLLHRAGVDTVVLERRSRRHVEERIRAGVLEQGTVDLLNEAGVGERMRREGLVHHGLELLFGGRRHRVPLSELADGRAITVYGQHEVVKDLIAARLAAGGELAFEAEVASLHDLDGTTPRVRFRQGGEDRELACDFVAGCDGFHGVCRDAIPAGALQVFERTYPFAWLGILAEAPPASDELIYASHERGFALLSMRSPTISRLYLQVEPGEDVAGWPDERVWAELHVRLETGDGWKVAEGPVLQKGVTGMRSFVAEPMRHGRLFLAGDAAHIVPPTGAKGMNLAAHDALLLSRALAAFYASGRKDLLDGYSAAALRRVWRAEHFSWWMTSMLHRFADDDAFGRRLQRAQLHQVTTSRAAATVLAENYVGLPAD